MDTYKLFLCGTPKNNPQKVDYGLYFYQKTIYVGKKVHTYMYTKFSVLILFIGLKSNVFFFC